MPPLRSTRSPFHQNRSRVTRASLDHKVFSWFQKCSEEPFWGRMSANEQSGTVNALFEDDEIEIWGSEENDSDFGSFFREKGCEGGSIELDCLTLETQSTIPDLEFGETPRPYIDEHFPLVVDSDGLSSIFSDRYSTEITKCRNCGGVREDRVAVGRNLFECFSLGTRSSIADEEPEIEEANFPWDVQMPPCGHRIEAFQELEDHMASVPEILEAFTATYPPCWSRYRRIKSFLEMYGDAEAALTGLVSEDRESPPSLNQKLVWAHGGNVGVSFPAFKLLSSLFPAFEKLCRKSFPEDTEDQIVEGFVHLVYHGLRCAKMDCKGCRR
jgi:hypothetical protein